jgi:hypothetical protein
MVLARKDFDLGQCPLMPLRGHRDRADGCLLSGGKADIAWGHFNVRF